MPLTLISTIYEGEATNAAIIRFSPDKVILVGVDKSDPERKSTLNKSIAKLKEKYKLLKFEMLNTSIYDIARIAEDVSDKIAEEFKLKNDIILHISEGRKTQFLGLLFAGYLQKDKIKGIYYMIQETNQALAMPLLDLKLSETKKFILKELSEGNKKISAIVEKSKKSKSMIYAHIEELKKKGFLSENLDVTDVGRICLL